MKGKVANFFLWILSISFFVCAVTMTTVSWAGILFLVPAVLLNPALNNLLRAKFNFGSRWWIKLCSAIVPMIIFGTVVPAAPASSPLAAVSSALSTESTESVKTVSTVEMKAPIPASGAKLNVHYIDVGQGDSEFLELPNGQTMLIDAGSPENGSQIISYIKGLNHKKIDYLVATHPHADHIGGMATVVNGLDIGKIYMPKVSTNTQTFEDLLTTIQKKGLKVNTAKAGVNMFKAGNLSADIIAPVNISGDDLNQYSAVLMLTYGDNKFLFTGDAGEASESQITADVKADVLKVGHHGSATATSQEFLNKVRPKYAVIEVGKGNSYGHPTADTLSKLQKIGAIIYRTDNDGTIIFTSDAHTITVSKKASSVKEQAPPSSSSAKEAAVVPASPKKPATSSKETTPAKPKPKVTAPAQNNQSVTVYITDTGSKYHTGDCRYLRKSKHPISLSDAKAQGYGPCKVCHPPT